MAFNNRIEFKTKLIPYTGDDCLGRADAAQDESLHGQRRYAADGRSIMGGPCEFCSYARARMELTMKALEKKRSQKLVQG